jgi:uncharacterized membrane protein
MNDFFSGVHLHLLVNHAPIFGALFGFALLVSSLLFAPDVLRRAAFVVLIANGIAAFVADQTGEPAEDAIRGFPGVRRELVHEHEDSGEQAFIAAAIVGAIALGALVRWRRTPVPRGITLVVLVGAAVVSVMMAYTGLLGGRIRHTEVRPGAVPGDAMIVEPPPPRRQRPPEQ